MHAMIVGSGLIARAFAAIATPELGGACVYAAGVSNSSCRDEREFKRERERLLAAMRAAGRGRPFLYFSTCSIGDSQTPESAYVRHKQAMEQLIAATHDRHLILRLPQLAGITQNPHTLLNYLFARIVRSERFQIWTGAQRNIIDIDDVVKIAIDLATVERATNETINVASTHSSSMREIVTTMADLLGREAIFDAVDRGSSYAIDVSRINASLTRTGVSFPAGYLRTVLEKYYGSYARRA